MPCSASSIGACFAYVTLWLVFLLCWLKVKDGGDCLCGPDGVGASGLDRVHCEGSDDDACGVGMRNVVESITSS